MHSKTTIVAVRPDSIQVGLYADGELLESYTLETEDADGNKSKTEITDGMATLSEENNWTAKATGLPKLTDEGTEISYEWKEEETPAYYESEAETTQEEDSDGQAYTLTKIKNSSTVEYGKIKVEKDIDRNVYESMETKPSFTFRLTGTDIYGNSFEDTKTLSFEEVSEEEKASEDDYIRLSAEFTDLELGSYVLTEDGTEYFKTDAITETDGGTVVEDEDGNFSVKFEITAANSSELAFATWKNNPSAGRLKVNKYDSDGKTPLEGVTFLLHNKDDSSVKDVELSTDENGEVIFDKVPCGNYTITETSTVKGHSLLTDPIEVTLPLKLTYEEVQEKGADITKAIYSEKTETFDFYELTYNVTDHATLKLPMTGAKMNWLMFVPILIGIACLTGGGYYASKRKKGKTMIG